MISSLSNFFYSHHVLFLNCEKSKKQFNITGSMGKMACLGLALKYFRGDRVKWVGICLKSSLNSF